MFKIPKLNIPKQLFASNPMQRPSAPQPQPQPMRPFFTGGFGAQIARVPQPTPQPAMGLSGLGMFSNFRPLMQNPNAQQMPTASQGGFFGNPFIRAQQMPNFGSATGINAPQGSGLFGLGPQNPMQTPPPSPQDIQNTMSTNFAAGMTPGMGFPAAPIPGGMQQTAQTEPLFQQSPYNSGLGYGDTTVQNMMAGPGMGFPAAPVQGGSATGVSAPPTGGLSSLGFS